MKIEELLKRFKIEFVKINLIQASLDSILFFLSSNLILFLFSLHVVGSIENYYILGFLTIFFFAGDLIYRIRTYHLELYEENNPELREVLRTARDNLNKSNTVSEALFEEVMDRARSVTSESIIPSREIIKKILAIGLLCFLTVGSGLVDFQIIQSSSNIVSDFKPPGIGGDSEEEESDVLNGTEVLGEPSDIEIDSRDLEFDISGRGDSSESSFEFEAAGENITFESLDQRNQEDMEIAKEYSLAIKDFS